MYIIETGNFSKITRHVIEKIVKNNLVLTFDVQRYNKWDKILIDYIIGVHRYTKENNRIYLKDECHDVFKNMMSFCHKNNIKYLLLYTKGVKNHVLDTDKNDSVFIRVRDS